MKYPCTGVILAGGLNTRFYGKEKALLEIAGARILDRIFDTFKTLFTEIILVTNDPLTYLGWDAHIVTDIFPKRSALTGIHAGLYYSTYSHVFVSASDTPFLQRALIETILGEIKPASEVIIPETSAGLEPLCAVYSKKRLPRIENLLSRDIFKIQMLFKDARMVKMPETRLRESDPDLMSFININTPRDLEKASKILCIKESSHEDHKSHRSD
jgi:molybdenum cofactor guanylyltransferase